jgi:hypothetical protein
MFFQYFSQSTILGFSVYMVPLGLLGELNMTNLVLGVIAASSCSGVILKSVSMVEGMTIDFASARVAIAE